MPGESYPWPTFLVDGVGVGIHANAAMWLDPALKNTCMVNPVGGSVSFYDSYDRLVSA